MLKLNGATEAAVAAAATHPIKSDVEANSKDLISIHIFSLITISHSEMYVMITTHHIRNDELRLVWLTPSLSHTASRVC